MEVSTTRSDEEAGTLMEGLLARRRQRASSRTRALAASEAQANAFWDLRESLSEVQKAEGASIKHDVSVPLSRLPAFLARRRAPARRRCPACGSAPSGISATATSTST